MTLEYLGIGLVLVVGILVVAYGWLSDRTENKRRYAAMSQPPDRPIPGLPADAPAPQYVVQHELLADPAPVRTTRLTEDARAALLHRLDGAPGFPHGHLSPYFATDPDSGLCVLHGPWILVADEEVTTLRELLPLLERAAKAHRAIVVVAPGFSEEVVATLVVNAVKETLSCVALALPDAGQRRAFCSLVGATPVPREDLRAGYVPESSLGTCGTFVSSSTQLWILDSTG